MFTAVVDHPECEWPRLLDRLCGDGDSSDRREVERMLRADRSAGRLDRSLDLPLDSPRDPPLPGPSPRVPSFPASPTQVGKYRLLHPIGRGALSVVYLAVRTDDAYRRRVAIKLIRPEVEDPSTLRRFVAERQILAGLEHPNIACLYDGGEAEDGRPYLAMEYVEGQPITEYCDARRLGIKPRLRLFLSVCAAVQHAHQSLLVHRDLKPGNILVTADGTVKLLDFGIAKLLAPREGIDPRSTETGHRPMTPLYASPEQIQGGPITTATDVYSLGVLLFELLTGLRPYRLTGDLPHELELAICDKEPELASGTFAGAADERAAPRAGLPKELRRQLRGDVDTILARALRKEPERRYPSARQFAGDLERHLAHRPILARQDHLGYRFGKFTRRHRTVLAVASLAFLVVATLLLVVHRQAGLLDSRQHSTERLTDLFLERLTTAEVEPGPDRTIPRQSLENTLLQVAPRLGADGVGMADFLETLGWVYRNGGLTEDARWLFEESLERRRKAGGAGSDAGANGRHALGTLLVETGELAAGEIELRRAVALHRRAGGGATYVFAESLESLGKLRWSLGDLEEAETLLAESLEVKRRVCPQAIFTADAISDLGRLALERLRFAAATPWLAEAGELREHFSPKHGNAARGLEDQALLSFARGELLPAQDLFGQAVELRRKQFGDLHMDVLKDLVRQARALIPLGRYQEAVELLREALSIHRSLELGSGPQLAGVLKHLGRALVGAGDQEAAEALVRKVIEIETGWLPPNHPHLAISRQLLGEVLQARGDLAGAEAQYRRAAADLEGRPEWDFGAGTEPRLALAGLLLERGDVAAAQAELRRAQALLQASHPPGHWRLAEAETLQTQIWKRVEALG